jgi:hypothetical protein
MNAKLEVELMELQNEELRGELKLTRLALVGMSAFTALSYFIWTLETVLCKV